MLWWKRVAVYESETAEAQVAGVGFQNTLIIMGVFAALPVTELIRSYLGVSVQAGALTKFCCAKNVSTVFIQSVKTYK